jgi:spore coat polysaccharide biosynthesis protein SpsF (cytidylyltransferase family)
MEQAAKVKRVAVVQARTSSSRLPAKVLKPIGDKPMIDFMLRRVSLARLVDEIIVATSTEASDDLLSRTVIDCGFQCFRGDLSDVLLRFDGAASETGADVIVRLTADCPLIDAELIDKAIGALVEGDLDYVSNVDPPTYPDGLDVEAFTREVLTKVCRDAVLPGDREHVTPYIRRNKDLFRQLNFRSSVDLSTLRWTVDHADDLALVRNLVDAARGLSGVAPDRFDYLRAFEQLGTHGVPNPHPRNERFPES